MFRKGNNHPLFLYQIVSNYNKYNLIAEIKYFLKVLEENVHVVPLMDDH